MLQKGRALPLYQRGNKLFIAISDPSNLQIIDDIKFQTGLHPEIIIVEDDKLTKIIEASSSKQEMDSFSNLGGQELDLLDITSGEEDAAKEDATSAVDDTPIVRFVNKMLLDAIHNKASDIHFEPYENSFRVRFRQDGILREHTKPPANLAPRIAARIKVMSQLDISERRIPQDGRFKMHVTKHQSIDFRISSCPTLYGEKIVMRILDSSIANLDIEKLGFEEFQKKLFLEGIHKPHGMVLVTGPTGSGKTVSLYTALNILNTPVRNISTVEDPVEINLPGINQVNVNVKSGLTFAVALRAFLRQDPNVVMVGEIRDLETAEIAVKAAQTGHMVLSTLHTNSAADTLNRLINMGIPSFNLATSISVVIAQRLARRLCPECKEIMDIPVKAKVEMGFNEEEAKDIVLYKAVGCNQCHEGYKGRVGLYEVMPISTAISEIIMQGANAIEISKQAQKEGIWNIRQSGLNKLRQGITTFEEVYRISKE
jgi:type IV pilus assembly protein PilB